VERTTRVRLVSLDYGMAWEAVWQRAGTIYLQILVHAALKRFCGSIERTLRRNIGPLLLIAILFVLTLNGMLVARLLTSAGVPVFWIRLPIAIFGAIYYLRVLFAVVEIIGSLLKRKFYDRYRLL
jgi:hypothetical protein